MCGLQTKELTYLVTGAHKKIEKLSIHDDFNPSNCTNFPGSLPYRYLMPMWRDITHYISSNKVTKGQFYICAIKE